MKFLKCVFLAALFAAVTLAVRPAAATCSGGNFYNAYPNGIANYPVGTLNTNNQGWPFGSLGVAPPGEFFEWPSASGLTLATANGNELSWLDVTSGELKSKWVVSPQYKRAFIDTGATGAQFRAVFYAHDWYRSPWWPFDWQKGATLRVTNSKIEARFNITKFEDSSQAYRGVHLFQRYRSEDEYYVASLRTNGDVVLQHQSANASLGCPYTPLTSTRLKLPGGGTLAVGTSITLGAWYKLSFEATTDATTGNTELRVYINDVWQFTYVDSSSLVSDGLSGMRTDFVDTWVDDIVWTDL
jgi:hypothetical protein